MENIFEYHFLVGFSLRIHLMWPFPFRCYNSALLFISHSNTEIVHHHISKYYTSLPSLKKLFLLILSLCANMRCYFSIYWYCERFIYLFLSGILRILLPRLAIANRWMCEWRSLFQLNEHTVTTATRSRRRQEVNRVDCGSRRNTFVATNPQSELLRWLLQFLSFLFSSRRVWQLILPSKTRATVDSILMSLAVNYHYHHAASCHLRRHHRYLVHFFCFRRKQLYKCNYLGHFFLLGKSNTFEHYYNLPQVEKNDTCQLF